LLVDRSDPATPGPEPRPASALSHAIPGESSAPQLRPDTPTVESAPGPAPSAPRKRVTIRRSETDTPAREVRTSIERKVRRPTEYDAQGRIVNRNPRIVNVDSNVPTPPEPRSRELRTKSMLPYRLWIRTSDEREIPVDPEKDIAGTRYIELTREELKKLGIQRTDGTLEVFGEERREIREWVAKGQLEGYDTASPEAIVRFRATIDSNLAFIGSVPNPTPQEYSSVAPVVIQCQHLNATGSYRAMVYFNRSPLLSGNGGGLSNEDMDLLAGYSSDSRDISEMTASPSLDRLVAVHVPPEDDGKGGRTADVHLWYLPTDEFVALLPDRYRDALRKEVETIAAVQREKLPVGAACERLTGERTFLDICRTQGGALRDGALIHNADRSINVKFRSTEMRTVSINLHDMNGRFIRSLSEFGETAGENSVAVDLGGIASGTYLVVIRSDKGEQLVQRLIVR
jgi:hypothetical protein